MGSDEEKLLVIENSAATSGGSWYIQDFRNGGHLWKAWPDSPPGREGSQEKWESGGVLK